MNIYKYTLVSAAFLLIAACEGGKDQKMNPESIGVVFEDNQRLRLMIPSIDINGEPLSTIYYTDVLEKNAEGGYALAIHLSAERGEGKKHLTLLNSDRYFSLSYQFPSDSIMHENHATITSDQGSSRKLSWSVKNENEQRGK